jgi:transcriptional regulator with XRE-family HTH domain
MPRAYNIELIAAIGRRLRQVREGRGIAQERLAEMLHVNPVTLSRAETGAGSLSITNLARAAEALQVPLAALFEFEVDEGLSPAPNQAEHEVMAVFRRLSPAHQRVLVRLAEELEAAERDGGR